MATITSQQLIAINLRYGTTAKALKPLAFADLSAKALFSANKSLTIKEISSKVAELINIRSVSEDLIRKGLNELKNDKKVFENNGKWELKSEVKKEITEDVETSSKELLGVLTNHFPQNINSEELSAWFIEAITDFFTYNGDEWVQSICKGPQNFSRKLKTVDELLNASIKKHKFEARAEELKNSFNCFLSSDKENDQRYMANIGFAMFSARLVAADVGADPIALDELKNATFLVDTNFLYALQLDSHKLALSLAALGKTLSTIGTKLLFLNETREEYGRVWNGRKTEVLKLFEVYPEEVVMEADDDFISSAIARGCVKKTDFETFFESIKEIPTGMTNGPDIKILEDGEIIKEVEKGKNDGKIKACIQKWCQKLRPRWKQPKSASALSHDAALVHITEIERKNNKKFYILTLDRGFQACCAERAGNHEISSAIHLEGLIHILAANNAGPELDATNFAPLLASLLVKQCIPPEHTYSSQDLHWLYSIQKNIAKFKPGRIKEIALEVTKARLAGKKADDDKLQRTVNRLYQEEIQDTNRIVDDSLERARKAEEDAGSEKAKRMATEEQIDQIQRREQLRVAGKKLFWALSWRIPAVLFLSLVVFRLASLIFATLKIDGLLDFVVTIGTLVGGSYGFIKSPIKKYLEIKNEVNKK